jgi:acetoin utilization protein AcuC
VDTALVYSPDLDAYDLAPHHPLRPERVSGTIALLAELGLTGADGPLRLEPPRPATRAELERVHSAAYVDAVMACSDGRTTAPAFGLGTGDNPVFAGMHAVSALIAGATVVAVESVTSGRFTRAFAPAGGLHHAHPDRASGFCVYNDVAVAIAAALAERPELRVCYIDIDAHHGDGVQAAFYDDPRVLTISVHESGRYLFPGTGFTDERGAGPGLGSALNIPLPPYADDACYRLVFDEAIAPAVRAFAPNLIVSQNGADTNHADPLTTLGLTLGGFAYLARGIIGLADELTGGRIVACGGGGYAWESVVPKAWTAVAAALAEAELPDGFLADEPPSISDEQRAMLLATTRRTIESLG